MSASETSQALFGGHDGLGALGGAASLMARHWSVVMLAPRNADIRYDWDLRRRVARVGLSCWSQGSEL